MVSRCKTTCKAQPTNFLDELENRNRVEVRVTVFLNHYLGFRLLEGKDANGGSELINQVSHRKSGMKFEVSEEIRTVRDRSYLGPQAWFSLVSSETRPAGTSELSEGSKINCLMSSSPRSGMKAILPCDGLGSAHVSSVP